MMFDKRVFKVEDIKTKEELAEKLTNHTWCLCMGFRLKSDKKSLLFLNDSFSEDGAGEWAVYDETTGHQIESITFSWIDEIAKAVDCIQRCIEEAQIKKSVLSKPVLPNLNHPSGTCSYCA